MAPCWRAKPPVGEVSVPVREELLPPQVLPLSAKQLGCIDANRQQLSQNKIRHRSCHYAHAQCTPALGPQFRAGGGIGWMEEVGENWAGTGVVLSLTYAFSATHAWCSWRSSFLEVKYLFTSTSGFFFFFFPSFFLSKIVCQWIGRAVFVSSFMSNDVTVAYLEQLCMRCLERECTEAFWNGGVGRKTTGCRTALKCHSWGKPLKVIYILPFVLIFFPGKQHFVYPVFSALH